MSIGTSDGQYYEDEMSFHLSHSDVQSINPDIAGTHNDPNVYDYEGFLALGMSQGENGHYPDTFKLPAHITFSDESKYNGVDGNEGGHWSQLTDDRWSFTPGATNFQNHSLQEMQEYFKKYEPGNVLNAVAAMDDFEKKGMTSGKIPEIQGGGSRSTQEGVQFFKDLAAREPYPNTPLTTRGTITRKGLDSYNMNLRRSPADNTLRSRDQFENDWEDFNTPNQ